MENKKRVLSLFLSLILLGSVLSISGCGSDKNKESSISQAEWLSMINETFGMYSYDSDTPYFKNIKKDNKYFTDVQIAYEWGIIDGNNFDADKSITKNFVAKTLVTVVGLESVKDMKDNEITELASNEGYVTFSYSGKSDGNHIVKRDEAIMSLGASKDKWLDFDFEGKSTLEVKDDVVSLTDNGATVLDCEYDTASDCLKVPEEYAKGLESGSLYVAPAMSNDDLGIGSKYDLNNTTDTENEYGTDDETALIEDENNVVSGNVVNGSDFGMNLQTAHKVDKVDYIDGYAYIYNSKDDVDLDDVIDDYECTASNVEPDFSVMPVVDSLGNRIYADEENMSQQTYKVILDDDGNPVGIEKFKNTASKDMSVGKDTTLTIKVSETEVSAEVKYKKDNVTGSVKNTFKNFNSDINFNLFDLKNTVLKTDFDTVISSSIKVDYKKELISAPEYSNGNGKYFTNFKRAVLKDSKSKGAKSIKICSIPLVGNGIYLGLDVRLKFSIDGTISVETNFNTQMGIECKNGKTRLIKDINFNGFDVSVKANAKALIYAGFNVTAAGKNILGIGSDIGVGCSYEQTMNLVSDKNVLLETCSAGSSAEQADAFIQNSQGSGYRVDLCSDLTTYGIWEVGFDDSSLLAEKFIKFEKIKAWDKDNKKIKELSGHFEDGKKVDKCTRKYDDSEVQEILTGDTIVIDKSSLNMKSGQSETINITTIPKNYSVDDVVMESSDNNVVTVDESGNVNAVGEGIANIVVKIPDTSFEQVCVVRVQGVSDNEKATFEPLPDAPTF